MSKKEKYFTAKVTKENRKERKEKKYYLLTLRSSDNLAFLAVKKDF